MFAMRSDRARRLARLLATEATPEEVVRSIVLGAGLGLLVAFGGQALRAQNQPTLVVSPVVAHELDSLWLESYTMRKEMSGCFKPSTYQVMKTSERVWAIVIGPMTPSGEDVVASDSVEVHYKSHMALCDSLDITVHTHILPAGIHLGDGNVTVRWEASENDEYLAASRPALFSLIVAAPDSVFVYGAKPKALWR